MDKLDTIQTKEKLNEVYRGDKANPGEAHYLYYIKWDKDGNGYISTQGIQFQKGPRSGKDSQHGIIDSDLLEIVRDRLKCFQAGLLASDYNAIALYHIEEALKSLNNRVEDRIKRNVLGEDKK